MNLATYTYTHARDSSSCCGNEKRPQCVAKDAVMPRIWVNGPYNLLSMQPNLYSFTHYKNILNMRFNLDPFVFVSVRWSTHSLCINVVVCKSI